jgi:hypothetical protein
MLFCYGNQTKKIKKDVNFSMSFFYLLLLNSNERDQFLSKTLAVFVQIHTHVLY